MEKILFITIDTNPENKSVSKTIGKEFINKLLAKYPAYKVEELDLYTSNIPEMNSAFVTEEIALVTGEAYDKLSVEYKKSVDRLDELCNQFLSSDIYANLSIEIKLFYLQLILIFLLRIQRNNIQPLNQ